MMNLPSLSDHPLAVGALISFLVFPFALGITALARHASAALRYLLLLCAFLMAAMALPLFISGLRIVVPILPAKGEEPLPLVRVNQATPAVAEGREASVPGQFQSSQEISALPAGPSAAPASEAWQFSFSNFLLWVWLVPTATLFGVLIFGLWKIFWLRRESSRPAPSHISSIFHRLCLSHNVSHPPVLLVSDKTNAPFACGVVRRFIVLPEGCDDWPSQTAEPILLHELAHCVRLDVAGGIFARVVASVFWFNPFAWICLGKLRAHSEMAADDYVVTRFRRSGDYASALLDQLKNMREQAWRAPQAIGIVRKDGFEERIERILDTRAARGVPGVHFCITLLTGTALLGVVLPILQPVAAVSASIKGSTSQAIQTGKGAQRGKIFDRKGELLAGNTPVYRVVSDNSVVADPAAVARVASPFLKIPEDSLRGMLQTKNRYKVLQKNLSGEAGAALRAALAKQNLRGISFVEDSLRIYPGGLLAGDILGVVELDADGAGKAGSSGVERVMESFLKVTGGSVDRNPDGTMRGNLPEVAGRDVFLTIDAELQRILEGELDAANKELKPGGLVGIVMDPRSGEILAMANRPVTDPVNPSGASEGNVRNLAISGLYEPGAIFRVVAAAGALEKGKVNSTTSIDTERGRFQYQDRAVVDQVPYGKLTVAEILAKSSSIGAAKLALLMGEEEFYDYAKRFGYGDRTGVELPGEIPGRLPVVAEWDKFSIARMATGSTLSSTPLQIAMGMSVIANGGALMRPHIVREIKDAGGTVVGTISPEKVRDVISPETVSCLIEGMSASTEGKGIARLGGVKGLKIAGMVSTSQKLDTRGGYEVGKYITSFVGFLPADNPQFLCLILVDDAKVKSEVNYGGLVAAPIFARVAEKSARHLGILPQ